MTTVYDACCAYICIKYQYKGIHRVHDRGVSLTLNTRKSDPPNNNMVQPRVNTVGACKTLIGVALRRYIIINDVLVYVSMLLYLILFCMVKHALYTVVRLYWKGKPVHCFTRCVFF